MTFRHYQFDMVPSLDGYFFRKRSHVPRIIALCSLLGCSVVFFICGIKNQDFQLLQRQEFTSNPALIRSDFTAQTTLNSKLSRRLNLIGRGRATLPRVCLFSRHRHSTTFYLAGFTSLDEVSDFPDIGENIELKDARDRIQVL